MKAKIIKCDHEYELALEHIDKLMDAKIGTPEGDELELFVSLVERYEQDKYPIGFPDPIEAIKFRMEQDGLKQRDLLPYIGSRAKVSEVLSGKRSLSLRMVRALNKGLNIPAEVLLQEKDAVIADETLDLEWDKFPIAEMIRRDWVNFKGSVHDAREQAEELLQDFKCLLKEDHIRNALLRQHVRSGSGMDRYALLAWCVKVLMLAQQESVSKYSRGTITKQFMQRLVNLSYLDEGPMLAKEFLQKNGIHLIVLRHLPRTHLDGAAMSLPDGTPVIALTLLRDRLDNFWFTLCHELAHVAKHMSKEVSDVFVDDLQFKPEDDPREKEADTFAADSLISKKVWDEISKQKNIKPVYVVYWANRLRVHPAIVAGRIRWEKNNHKILTNLVGCGEVRSIFGMNN